ncbi:poly(A) polymerase [Cribrihabitans marinus]|uniref:Poly(A) polymerase n=1 Tax=Cribrihabitans marinus TaxID=1227549 RepID=A0A1H6YJ13_9RHOB|nr:CCA tRNA nucleotidyltransferase [Cribrihabitans marinus]GGH28970.1 poly(A) polymerase [Cribrihabitans marinus]SEJ38957.1 poly(A) polymerase [Cribrihabitans marinus]
MTRIREPWLSRPETQAVCGALTDGGAQALFVGGCVRNALLGESASDIDIATDARPERVMDLAKAAGIKAVPTGIAHGTVTLVKGGIPHEITTFRRDVETDGRRAVVAYSGSVAEDAARRDFTMNALYASPDGSILDPLGGLPDLEARRVRFIGDAGARIREDYLRSLRYFRFHAWFGDPQAGFDDAALDAIAANLDGLQRLSRERVGVEMLKLLAAPDPAPAVAAMRSTGALARVLPGADDRALAPLVHLESLMGAEADAIRRLAALGGSDPASGLRLSRAQTSALATLRDAAQGTASPAELGYRLGYKAALDSVLLRAALLEAPLPPEAVADAEKGASAVFPIRAADLMPAYSGPALGAKLTALETKWIASGFALGRDDLLADGRDPDNGEQKG